jgi:hypothetical protein
LNERHRNRCDAGNHVRRLKVRGGRRASRPPALGCGRAGLLPFGVELFRDVDVDCGPGVGG